MEEALRESEKKFGLRCPAGKLYDHGKTPNVKLVEKKTLERREGKAERVVDLRKF